MSDLIPDGPQGGQAAPHPKRAFVRALSSQRKGAVPVSSGFRQTATTINRRMHDTVATTRGIRLAKFRDKLHLALKCQYDLLEKAVQGRTFSLVTIERAVADSGRIEELPYYRQLKRWWWKTPNGRYAIVIRYGYHRLPFARGRFVHESDKLEGFKDFLLTQMRRVDKGDPDWAYDVYMSSRQIAGFAGVSSLYGRC